MSVVQNPDWVLTPTRVLHGTKHYVAHLQSSLSRQVPEELQVSWPHCLDDILLYEKTNSDILDTIEALFCLCVRLNVKLHPDRCTLFSTELRWYGRLIYGEGLHLDPRNVRGLDKLQQVETGSQLQQFICELQWMHTALTNFSKLIAPLQDFL